METVRRNDLKNPVAIDELQRSFVLRVYGWMTLGLTVTAAASLYTLVQPNLLRALFESPLLLWGLLIIELVLVLVLSARIASLGVTTARIAFLGYAALTGISLTPLVLTYTASSLFRVFVITAGLFGAMCLYGHVTRRDLTAWASYLFMSPRRPDPGIGRQPAARQHADGLAPEPGRRRRLHRAQRLRRTGHPAPGRYAG